ncbi:MAG: L-serine ammonia-lyase, iron-sulfur-dependent, subunit alpha [Clostridia bacterium]|nr:L-serine ammonia-lyase, iron-sulfur-dependent, subunit alpha [Clostridia bacterium]
MLIGDAKYNSYISILREELVPAMGCTEPIAIAYAAALARKQMGGAMPTVVSIGVSGNIIKNVKSVVVPNTGGLKGIASAVAAGVIAGDSDKLLQVISDVTDEQREDIRRFLANVPIEIRAAKSNLVFDIDVTLRGSGRMSNVRLVNNHTNICHMECDGVVLTDTQVTEQPEDNLTDKRVLNTLEIVEFADILRIEDVEDIIARQAEYNYAIAQEGMRGEYGGCVGKAIVEAMGGTVWNRAKAMAAAGSDARMSGCELPVVILSGSGNQGITASVPVIEYAREIGASREKLYRALVLSDLLTIHQKSGIGRLSAFCGAVSAGSASGAAIAYLDGGGADAVAHTIVNALAIISGMVCDGAKASCAGKIAASVEAGIIGYSMYKCGREFRSGDGIVTKGVDRTIANVGRLAKDGMRQTDEEILRIMLHDVEATE